MRTDPLRNFKFTVVFSRPGFGWDNTPAGDFYGGKIGRFGFMSVSGLSVQTESIPYREGGMNTTTHKLPGQSDFPPLQLQAGLFDATQNGHAFWYWFKELFFFQQGEGYARHDFDFRSDVVIHQMAHPQNNPNAQGQGNIRISYKLHNAWPQSLAFSDLDAGGNAVAVQQLTLVHEGIDVKWSSGKNGLPLIFGSGK